MVAQIDLNQQSKKKRRPRTLIAVIVVLIAVTGLAAGYFNAGIRNSMAQMSTPEVKSITLPSITVNLVDNGYFKTTITLEYPASKKLDAELDSRLYKVKDGVLGVLRSTSTAYLRNPEKTEALKQELLKEINDRLVSGEVTGLYFEEFIVQ